MMAEADYREGLGKLLGRGHVFDATVYHSQLSDLMELVVHSQMGFSS